MNLSYSSLETLHSCPRKFELEKVLVPEGTRSESLDLIVGKSAHAGIQQLLMGASLERAVWEAYKEFSLVPGISIEESNKKKSFTHVVMHIQKFMECPPEKLQGWQVAWIRNEHGVLRPAIEVGFRIMLPGGFHYRGFIDAILSNGTDFTALEIKTTGFENANPALWHNSFQGMSYSMVTDYLSCQSNVMQMFLALEFPKLGQTALDFWRSAKDKSSWLPSLAMDVQAINTYRKHNHFPMRGANCFQFFRPCAHLGICNLARPTDVVPARVESNTAYDFNFSLQDLLQFSEELNGQAPSSNRAIAIGHDRGSLEACTSAECGAA